MICRLCKGTIDPEHPEDGGKALNPETMRWGWIHNWCLIEAIEQLSGERKEKYDDKVREWIL